MAVPEVDVMRAQEMVAAGGCLLDVRELDEWDAGHAPDALHVPMSVMQERVDDVPRDKTAVVVCRSGGRSARVTEFLIANGFDAVNVAGGMKDWAAAGFPVVADGDAPARIA